MRHSIAVLAALLLSLTAAMATGAQSSQAVQTMAGLLMSLHHFPSDSDKQALLQITQDKSATADERTVAQAMIDVQHTAAAADEPGLQAIIGSDKAAASVKTLADVVLNFHHMVPEGDKAKLQALTQ